MGKRGLLGQLEKKQIGEKLMDLGNIAAGALLFGQAFSGFPFDLRIAFLGIFTLVSLYTIAVYLIKETK